MNEEIISITDLLPDRKRRRGSSVEYKTSSESAKMNTIKHSGREFLNAVDMYDKKTIFELNENPEVDVNYRDPDGHWSALHCVAASKQKLTFQALLKRADSMGDVVFLVKDADGRLPLQIACHTNPEMARLFLEREQAEAKIRNLCFADILSGKDKETGYYNLSIYDADTPEPG